MRKEFKKENRKIELTLQAEAEIITKAEFNKLEKKINKTKDEVRMMKKYKMMKCFNISNTPKWFVKAVDQKYEKNRNIKRFQEMNGVVDQRKRYQLMGEIGNKFVNPNDDPGDSITNYDTIKYITETNKAKINNICWHALNILKLIGAEEFIREIPIFNVNSQEFTIKHINDYIKQNDKQIRELTNEYKIEYNIDNNKSQLQIIKFISKIINKAFGIKIDINPTGYVVDNMWIINNKNIWPYNNSDSDEELQEYHIPVGVDILEWTMSKILQINKNN